MTERVCRECAVPLVIGENVSQRMIDGHEYICTECNRARYRKYQPIYQREHREHVRERHREYVHRTGRYQPMSENRECPLFLGIYVSEYVLAHVFKNVHRMPSNNPGYDFICDGGHMVDVKSACRTHHENRADQWVFCINKNQIAEYFLMLAFDNRQDLNPEHIWLIPGSDINDHSTTSIAESRLAKWDKYKLDVDRVSTCCNTIKEIRQ